MSRRYRRPDLDSPFLWFSVFAGLVKFTLFAVFFIVVSGAWLAWLPIALIVGGTATLTRHRELAQKMMHSLGWHFLFRAPQDRS
jgi:hypothetical protein